MGTINTILAALFCAMSPLASGAVQENRVEQSESKMKLGKEIVSSIRSDYTSGKYTEFLNTMNSDYEQADLKGLVQMREKQIPVDFQEKWEERFTALQHQKNNALLDVLSDKDDSLFAEKVRSLAANISTPEQEKAISKINSLIVMAPKTGANDDENKLIDIDLEYEYKLALATAQEEQIALRMEKMDRMVAASKSFKDLSLKKAVGLAAANLDERLARNLDGADLNALVKEKAKPSTDTEEKVYSILSSYQGQFSDLMKELATATF